MATKKKDPLPAIVFLHNAFRIEHDGDNYILTTHCTCRRMPHYEGTKREWLSTGATGKTVDTIKRQLVNLHPLPFSTIIAEALDEALAQNDLLIPASPTKRPVAIPETAE